jgi:hypothetical protein
MLQDRKISLFFGLDNGTEIYKIPSKSMTYARFYSPLAGF